MLVHNYTFYGCYKFKFLPVAGGLLRRACLEYVSSNSVFQLNKTRRQRRKPSLLKEISGLLANSESQLPTPDQLPFFVNIPISVPRIQ